MKTRKLGKTKINVSPIVLGTWQFDSDLWKDSSEVDSIRTVHAAIEAGINTLDTAEAYGSSEELIGRALKGKRDQMQIFSKLNRRKEDVREGVEQSLRRLQTDYIDVYMAHYPPKDRPYAAVLHELDKLREEGKIRALGVSNFSVTQLEEALSEVRFDVCEPPYNILWREIELNGVLDFCRHNAIGILSYSSMAQGLLAGAFLDQPVPDDIHAENKLFAAGTFESCNEVAREVQHLSLKYNRSMAQIALNWVVHQPGVTAAIAGAERPWQIEDSVKAVGWELDPEDQELLSSLGLDVARSLDYSSNMWKANPEV